MGDLACFIAGLVECGDKNILLTAETLTTLGKEAVPQDPNLRALAAYIYK